MLYSGGRYVRDFVRGVGEEAQGGGAGGETGTGEGMEVGEILLGVSGDTWGLRLEANSCGCGLMTGSLQDTMSRSIAWCLSEAGERRIVRV